MAARKLKFKPKPVVGGAVRRPREKEEIPELLTQEATINQVSSHENDASNDDIEGDQTSKNNVSKGSEIFKANAHDSSEGNVSKRMRIEQVDNLVIASSTDIDSVKGSTDKKTTHITNNETNEQVNDSNVEVTSLEPVSTLSSDSNTSALVSPLCSKEITGDKPSNVPDNPISSPNLSKKISDSKPGDKTEVTKGLSRFGRSKFKPVLSNNISRKKVETSCNTVEVVPATTVRKESVIKCVKSDTTKSSLVSEITESFSALESDEIDLPVVSLPSPKDNNPEIEDIRNSSNIIDSNTRDDLECTKNLMQQPALEINKNKHKTSHDVQSFEISNSNVQTSRTKVPISPLKLASKILVPKPSPNLLDTATRRISFQGSDSEEDSKRKISLINNKIGKKIKKEKDLKNNKRKLSQGSTYSKLGQEVQEKFNIKFGKVDKLDATDKAKLTMLDLIFYNPKSNPMSVSSEPPVVRKKEDKFPVSGFVKEALAEQSVDDAEEVEAALAPPPAVPVPQLKVGPDGQIILDPNSLVIETTEVKEKRAEMEKSEIIRETGLTRYNTYSKKKHARRDWTAQETLQFYKALNTIGSDFTLMTKLFPTRTRHELKLKFKKEEKTNMKLVDLAMTGPTDFDFSSLEEEMKLENEGIAKQQEEKRLAAEAAKKARIQKREEKEKNKDKKYYYSKKRNKYAAFKDFDDAETEQIKAHCGIRTTKSKKKKGGKKITVLSDSSSEEEEEPVTIDLLSDEEELEESEKKLLKMIRSKTRPRLRKGRLVKQPKKLEEYEEINETLKRKLEEIDSDSSDDGYTPNGLSADMLFGSPEKDPFPTNPLEEADASQWSMEVASAEDGVFINDIDNVRELTELTSLERNRAALDPSSTADTNDEAAQQRKHSGSVLNRHLISESIQIIDQLTSNEELNGGENITSHELNVNGDVDSSNGQTGDKMSLPSFDSVSRTHAPVVYNLQEQCDKESATICEESNMLNKESNEEGNVLSYYNNDSEECILGD